MIYFTTSILAVIWLLVWALRHRYELDKPLDGISEGFRWAIVLLGFVCTYTPEKRLEPVRITAFVIGMSFLCWPNLAYRLTLQRIRERQA